MGAGSTGRGCGFVCLLLALGLFVAEGSTTCTSEDKCHFGSCEQKKIAVAFVSQNSSDFDCSHPTARALATFIQRGSEAWWQPLRTKCGLRNIERPACETRLVKTRLDTILIVIASTVLNFAVVSDLEFSQWGGD